jgi:tetratricopeptide (TPR) repeat protein
MEHAWVQEVVVPYLRRTYSHQVAALEAWVAHHGGLALGLDRLVGDPRSTARGGMVHVNNTFFPLTGAFESLVADVASGNPLADARFGFATELHYADLYDEALAITARVLADDPTHVGALALTADVYVHQGRLDDAERVARTALAHDPACEPAWYALRWAFEKGERWGDLREAVLASLPLYTEGKPDWVSVMAQLVRARAGSGDREGASRDLARVEAVGGRKGARVGARLRVDLGIGTA